MLDDAAFGAATNVVPEFVSPADPAARWTGAHGAYSIDSLIEGAGFRLERLETSYMPGPKPMTFMYEGSARPR